jgi:hypothetical protein
MVLLMIENAPIHLVTKNSRRLRIRMKLLSQYSAILAPVKLIFGGWKRRIACVKKAKSINCSNLGGMRKLTIDIRW